MLWWICRSFLNADPRWRQGNCENDQLDEWRKTQPRWCRFDSARRRSTCPSTCSSSCSSSAATPCSRTTSMTLALTAHLRWRRRRRSHSTRGPWHRLLLQLRGWMSSPWVIGSTRGWEASIDVRSHHRRRSLVFVIGWRKWLILGGRRWKWSSIWRKLSTMSGLRCRFVRWLWNRQMRCRATPMTGAI